jgi:hypothetical protein
MSELWQVKNPKWWNSIAIMEKFTRMEVALHLSGADYPGNRYREGAMVMARRAAMRSSKGG